MSNSGFLWAIGGKVENKYTVAATTVYDISANKWYSSEKGDLAAIPHPVQGAGWTHFENKIFCFGGKTDPHAGCCDYVQVYSIEENKWELYKPMPEARSKLGKYYPVIDDQYIYLFGGDNAQGPFSRVNWNWRYDLLNDTWNRDVADAPYSQSFPLPTLHNEWLYYSTGNTGTNPEQNNYSGALNQRYHPQKDQWEVMTPCPIPTTDGSGDKFGNELHIMDNLCWANSNGIALETSTNNTIINNNCSKNANGLYAEFSNNSNIAYNNFSMNQNGISLETSMNNTLYANAISENTGIGIYFNNSNDNIVWKNELMANGEYQVYSNNSDTNQWNFNGLGNYWGDYTTRYPDANNDGTVWDTPYEINGTLDKVDDYPLVIENPPTWDETPTDQSILPGESFNYDVNASDDYGIDKFWVNDMDTFQISGDGQLSNITSLSIGFYGLEISVNDTSGNEITAIIELEVLDTIAPIWDEEPSDQNIFEGEPFSYDVNASDNIAIALYSINDTENFQIDQNGNVTNLKVLTARTYGLNITVTDTSGNEISTEINIVVETIDEETDEDPDKSNDSGGGVDELPAISGYNLAFALVTSLISIALLVLVYRKQH